MKRIKKKKNSVWGVISLIIVLGLTIFFLFPFYWIITGSFKDQFAVIAIPPEWFPKNPTLINYKTLFNMDNAFRWIFNSFFTATMTMLIGCTIATMAGYALGKKKFPGRTIIFSLFIAAMCLPREAIMIPLATLLTEMNWIDRYISLILPALGRPFGVFMMKQFSQTLPNEILESAKIDGCSEWRTFVSIAVPILKPGIGAMAIFTFITSWNDYISQLFFLRSPEMQTLPLGLATMQSEYTTNYGLLMAGAAVASLPMIIIFMLFQKYFTQGITMGAVKG